MFLQKLHSKYSSWLAYVRYVPFACKWCALYYLRFSLDEEPVITLLFGENMLLRSLEQH